MLSQFVSVWNEVVTFLVSLFPQIESIFYTTGENGGALTFVGVMAVIMAGVALVLLVFNLIRSFLAMRG